MICLGPLSHRTHEVQPHKPSSTTLILLSLKKYVYLGKCHLISGSATQGQPVVPFPFLWTADVSSNPNAEITQLTHTLSFLACFRTPRSDCLPSVHPNCSPTSLHFLRDAARQSKSLALTARSIRTLLSFVSPGFRCMAR